MSAAIDLTGQRFGRLVALRIDNSQKHRLGRLWECQCDCGGIIIVIAAKLRNGHTRSCGCLYKDSRKWAALIHGHATVKGETSEYRSWRGMIQRVFNPKNNNYPRYGGRGIKICDRWLGEHGFENFLEDMGPKPGRGFSIERRDNDGDYEPNNCYWATPKEQAANRSSRKVIEVKGIKKSQHEWGIFLRVDERLIHNRLRLGWSEERAILTPFRKINRKRKEMV